MPDENTENNPPTTPTVPVGTTPDEGADETTAKDRREAKKEEKELIERATFNFEGPAEDDLEAGDLFVTAPPTESPFNNDGFLGVDPTLQGPSDVRSVGPDTK